MARPVSPDRRWRPWAGSRCAAALPASRTPTMLNGWPRTPPCESSLDGEAPRDKQVQDVAKGRRYRRGHPI